MKINYTMIPNRFVQKNQESESVLKTMQNKKLIAYIKVISEATSAKGYSYFSIENILNECKISVQTRNTKELRNVLSEMESLNYIDLLGEDIQKTNPLKMIKCKLNIFEINDKDEKINYFKLLDNEWNTIINYSGKEDKFNILNIFCTLKSRMWNGEAYSSREKVAYPSYENISESTGVTWSKSIKKYLDILSDKLELIAYTNAGDRTNGKIRLTSNNTYILRSVENYKEELKNAINTYEKYQLKNGFTIVKTEESTNEKRRITSTINALENTKKYQELTTEQNEKLEKAYQERKLFAKSNLKSCSDGNENNINKEYWGEK